MDQLQTTSETSNSMQALLDALALERSLECGTDPRKAAREAGPEVSFGLPHRGERRRLR